MHGTLGDSDGQAGCAKRPLIQGPRTFRDAVADVLKQAQMNLAAEHERVFQLTSELFAEVHPEGFPLAVPVKLSHEDDHSVCNVRVQHEASRIGDLEESPKFLMLSKADCPTANADVAGDDVYVNRMKSAIVVSNDPTAGPHELLPSWKKWQAKMASHSAMRQSTTEVSSKYNEAMETDSAPRPRGYLSPVMWHPSNHPRIIWDLCSLALVVLDIMWLPFGVFDPPRQFVAVLIEWLTRIFWSVDMVLSFFTGFVTEKGFVEMRPEKIALKYVRSWFVLDLIIVGLDWAEPLLTTDFGAFGFARIAKISRLLKIVRLLRLLRLVRMREIVNLLMERINSRFALVMLDVAKLLFLMLSLGHLIACVWYEVGKSGGESNWIVQEGFAGDSIITRYLISMRWSMSQFSGGMDEVVPHNDTESFFALLVATSTFWSGAVFVSALTSSMTQLYLSAGQHSQSFSVLRRFLSQCGISKSLSMRVNRNAQYAFREQKRRMPETEVSLMCLVSEPLRVEIHFEMFTPILSCHPFFADYIKQCPHVVRKICHHAMEISGTYLSGDVVFNEGETPEKPTVSFVRFGEVFYESSYNVFGSMSAVDEGTWISEACLWVPWTHRGTLKVLQDCQFYRLDAERFQQIALQFVHADFDLARYAEEFVNWLNSDHKEASDVIDLRNAFRDLSSGLGRWSSMKKVKLGRPDSVKSTEMTKSSKCQIIVRWVCNLVGSLGYSGSWLQKPPEESPTLTSKFGSATDLCRKVDESSKENELEKAIKEKEEKEDGEEYKARAVQKGGENDLLFGGITCYVNL
eukprot:TRINITY_DN2166_c1_g1_i2.p1 TRINITY_DN2166_c1_g1~~TRINITY_DN2166_c1_g1_i2.p1  ORF type:complete len:801 (+),score=109.65 TRINITY_DN2166_c1_g1_i2:119-2521(+)